MPPYFQPPQSSEIAQAPSSSRAELPQVVDIGPKLGEVGKEAMALAEPVLKRKAEEQAISDAGAASIVRTPEGTYQRSNLTHGGGSVYAEAYGHALDTRQVDMMEQDYLSDVDTASREWADDPQHQDPTQFWAFASGKAQAMLQLAPPSIRAELDTRLTRHMAQASRGFAEAVHTNQRRLLADDLNTAAQAKLKEIGNLAKAGGPDVGPQMDRVRGEYHQIMLSQHAAGLVGDTDTQMEAFDANTYDEKTFAQSTQSLQGFGPGLAHASMDDLLRLSTWGRGLPQTGDPKEKVGDMSFTDFRGLFPSQQVAREAGALADDEYNRRLALQNQQALQTALTPAPTAQQVLDDNESLNYLPASGMTKPQFAAAVQQYGAKGPVADQLRDPKGLQDTLAFFAGTGTTPPGTNNALRTMAFSSDEGAQQAALNFIWNARNVQTKGVWTGLNWFNNLPDDLKALSQFDLAMRHAGFNTTMELRNIYARTQGRLANMNEYVATQFGKQSDYDKAVNATIAQQFGADPSAMGPSAAILRHDFDRYMQINANLYPTKEQALQASAAMVATGWVKDDIFVGGVGDKRLATEGIPLWFMDRALAVIPGLRSGNPAGATFANGRVKIQALDESPGQAYPNYQFIFFNDKNQVLGRGAVHPMQHIVNAWHQFQGSQKAAADKEALDAMAPPVWKLAHDPAHGGIVRYVDNSAELNAWRARQDAKAAARAKTNAQQKLDSMGAAGAAGGLGG